MADRDQAIKHVLHSAFGHSGQKCSATCFCCWKKRFSRRAFRATLVDAAKSLRVGSAWDTSNRMGPMVTAPTGDLDQALKVLETGESWALIPRRIDSHQAVYSPGIKWNVQRGSYTHLTEFFGPVLGVMCFRSLSEAIQIVNETGYGLTSGLESLDDREQAEWMAEYVLVIFTSPVDNRRSHIQATFGGMGRARSWHQGWRAKLRRPTHAFR